jgi:hypothetical protein
MLRRISTVLLLVALLSALVASGAPALGRAGTCKCYLAEKRLPFPRGGGGCHFDQRTSQCVNTGCAGTCL